MRVGLSAEGRKLLSSLRVARTAEDLERQGLDRATLDALLAAGLLEPMDATRPPNDLAHVFAGWKSQRGMLVDHVRTEAFRRALAAVVRPGDVVVDVGAGSGVLAMFAAQAGAAEVVGLEVTEMAAWAQQLAAANGLDAVRIVKGDAARFDMDARADVIVSEFIGMTFLDEWRHFAAFVSVRDRLLRAGGAVVPHAGRLLLSAVDSHKLYWERGYGFYERPSYGIDFSMVRAAEIANPRRYIVTADYNSQVVTAEVAAFDFSTCNAQAFFFESEARMVYPAAGSFHGFLAHLELDMAPGQVLATGPKHRETCWHHTYLPMPRRTVAAGEVLAVRVRSFLDPDEDLLRLGLTVAGADETLDAAAEHVFPLE